jgi:hypothetical protein
VCRVRTAMSITGTDCPTGTERPTAADRDRPTLRQGTYSYPLKINRGPQRLGLPVLGNR